MFAFVARSVDRRLVFRDWVEALALWDRVIRAVPGLSALVLMPDHLHLVHPGDVRRPLAAALAGYARWRNSRRRETGPTWAPLPEGEKLADAEKRRRAIRYVHLNPCRARLVPDPLAWPFSTHRDAVGLAIPTVVRPRSDPHAFHRYVSADPSVRVDGTALPLPAAPADPDAVLVAVSALTRTPLAAMSRRGTARSLFLGAAGLLCPGASREEVAARVGLRRLAAIDASRRADPARRTVAIVVGDDRFPALYEGDLRGTPGWERYRGRG